MTHAEELSVRAKQSGFEPPFISIIVPVYNTQDELTECLISAVFQTLSEVEVIVVNDASPDDSQRIIDRFTALFPDKVRCVKHEKNQGLSGARHTGVLNARAPYVLFLDSDDFISGKICETLLGAVLNRSCDIMYFGSDWYDMGKGERRTILPNQTCMPQNIVKTGLAAFWGAMYRRSFLLDYQDIAFQRMQYEDAAATPVLASLAHDIGVCRKSMYFYNIGRPASITAGRMNPKKMDDLFYADIFPWENITEPLRPMLAERILRRAMVNMRKFPEIYDYSVFHIKELLEATAGSVSVKTKVDHKALEDIRSLPDGITIPKRVYINGFMRGSLRDFNLYLKQAQEAYLFDPEVFVLDASSCRMEELPTWLRDCPDEEKGIFFAVRDICENGGIYISPAVRIVKSFNREAFSRAFFVAGPDNCVLSAVFGGAPHNPVFENMLDALRKGSAYGREYSLEELMAQVLIGTCGVHLNGKEERGLYGLHMLHFKFICRSTNSGTSYCELDYSNFVGELTQDMVMRPRELDDFTWKMAADELEYSRNNPVSNPSKAQNELNEIYASRAWKLVTKMRLIRDKLLAAKNSVLRLFRGAR